MSPPVHASDTVALQFRQTLNPEAFGAVHRQALNGFMLVLMLMIVPFFPDGSESRPYLSMRLTQTPYKGEAAIKRAIDVAERGSNAKFGSSLYHPNIP